jgi:hypothetical protein
MASSGDAAGCLLDAQDDDAQGEDGGDLEETHAWLPIDHQQVFPPIRLLCYSPPTIDRLID